MLGWAASRARANSHYLRAYDYDESVDFETASGELTSTSAAAIPQRAALLYLGRSGSLHFRIGCTLPKKRLWLVEIWVENRDIFKAVVRDVLFFLAFMAVLSGGRYILERMPLNLNQRLSLENWHFRITVTAWVLLSLFLLVEIVVAFGDKIIDRVIAIWRRIRGGD